MNDVGYEAAEWGFIQYLFKTRSVTRIIRLSITTLGSIIVPPLGLLLLFSSSPLLPPLLLSSSSLLPPLFIDDFYSGVLLYSRFLLSTREREKVKYVGSKYAQNNIDAGQDWWFINGTGVNGGMPLSPLFLTLPSPFSCSFFSSLVYGGCLGTMMLASSSVAFACSSFFFLCLLCPLFLLPSPHLALYLPSSFSHLSKTYRQPMGTTSARSSRNKCVSSTTPPPASSSTSRSVPWVSSPTRLVPPPNSHVPSSLLGSTPPPSRSSLSCTPWAPSSLLMPSSTSFVRAGPKTSTV